MNNLNFKWLAAALLLCAPVFAWADDNYTYVDSGLLSTTPDVSWSGEGYENSGTATINDGTVTMNFTCEWGGLGWSNWNEHWDLSSYDKIVVEYEITDGSNAYLQLFIQDATSTDDTQVDDNYNYTGTIEYVLSEHSEVDYTSVAQIVLQSSAGCTATIKSIKYATAITSEDPDDPSTGDGGDDEGGESGEDTGGDNLDLSEGDATLTGAGTYVIKGNGTTGNYTIKFPENPSGEYNITLQDVTVNTNGSSELRTASSYYYDMEDVTIDNETCALLIPASEENDNFVVNITLRGTNSLTGSLCGIYVGENSTLNIHPTGPEEGETVEGVVNYPETCSLTINGEYGIYNLGESMTYEGHTNHNYLWGTTTINAVDCGIYSPNGLGLYATNMIINVSGEGQVTVVSDPNYNTTHPGYTIEKLVAGIVVGYDGCTPNIKMQLAVVDLTIYAPSDCTYGLFLDGSVSDNGQGATGFIGFGRYDITATQCVIHHQAEKSGWITSLSGGYSDQCIFEMHGPFCGHYVGYAQWGSYDLWYCDGSSDDGSVNSWISDPNMKIKLFDEDSEDYGYPYPGEMTVGEVEYVDRPLKLGWNTLCLPYRYDLDPEDTAEDDPYESEVYENVYEARHVISYYADFGEITQSKGEDGYTVFSFTEHSTTEEGEKAILEPNRAYLVYVDPNIKDVTLTNDTTVIVTFTSIGGTDSPSTNGESTVTLEQVKDDFDGSSENSDGEMLMTVFHPEYVTAKEQGGKHFKLVTYVYDNEDGTKWVNNYFNRPTSGHQVIVPAYRSYLDFDDSEVSGVKIVAFEDIAGGDEETTGIQAFDAYGVCTGDVDVYNMNGQLVKTARAGENVSNGLAKGVYIVGGKKVSVM